jgi:tRNA G18 (ribose-2'-O)-methylase SpoU
MHRHGGNSVSIMEIRDLEIPELEVYIDKKEVQLLHYYEPEPGIFIAESPNVILRALEAGYEPLSLLMEKKPPGEKERAILDRCGEIPVYTASLEVLTRITGYQLARGMLCAMRRKALPSLKEICEEKRRIAILEDVVNPTNVGAIFRSAAALSMDAVLLTKGSSDPLYRRAVRVSMGTVFQIPWTIMDAGNWPERAMQELRSMGYRTAAMALKEDSVSLKDERLKKEERLAIVLGTEGDGLAGRTIADCDYTVMIPMTHGVDSLNVAAASAVAFWELDPLF